MNKAMFINVAGDDDDYRSPIDPLSVIDDIGPMEQLLFPFMNFTCSGMITSLTFMARSELNTDSSQLQNGVLTSWPVFSLWQRMPGSDFTQILNEVSIPVIGDIQEGVLVINITVPSIPFQSGYILGLRQQNIQQPNNYIRVLRQIGGYGLTLISGNQNNVDWPTGWRFPAVNFTKQQEMPYITIDTSM